MLSHTWLRAKNLRLFVPKSRGSNFRSAPWRLKV